jgi:predicted Zn-dependent protease
MISRDHFEALAAACFAQLPGPDHGQHAERVSLNLGAEHSHFIRFNHGQVRQATDVAQAHVSLSRTQGLRSGHTSLTLSGVMADDLALLLHAARALGDDLPHLPEDPHTLLPDAVVNSVCDDASDTQAGMGSWPDPTEVVHSVAQAADGHDVVGLYAAGPIVRAYADNRGQRNWHRSSSFSLDWSHVLHTDQAVKSVLAGPLTPGCWPGVHARLTRRMQEAAAQMRLLAQAPQALSPGRYRAYLAPAAVAELLSTLAWGAFGLKEQRTGTSPFNRLVQGEGLSPLISLSETIAPGLAPAFTPQGFVRPDSVPLVAAGQLVGSLVSPRSAREFGEAGQAPLQPNTHGGESPDCLHLAAGTLPESQALATLGEGLYLSNLHYLNYSDRLQGRVTGMTRYACFWVEGGQLKAPLGVMRFDQDVLRLLGPDLVALTDTAHWQPDLQTYGSRAVGGVRTPGAVVAGLNLVL